MSHEAVIFDLDGTLLNTLEDLADSMNAVLRRAGFPTHGVDAYRYFVGEGMPTLVRRAVPEERRDEETLAACLAGMREEYSRRCLAKTRPYPGVPELLDQLTRRRVRMAVLSNKPQDATVQMVALLLKAWRFEAVAGARPGGPMKPDPAGALEIAAELALEPIRFLYVGDTATDMRTAVAAGMRAVGVLWGFRTADELQAAGADVLIQEPLDLLTHI